MRPIALFLAAAVILVSFTFTAYGQEGKKEDPAQSHGAMKEKRFVAAVDPDGVQHVEITGGDYFFEPNYIVVRANIPVALNLKKEKGYVPHDLMVKAPEAGIVFNIELKEKPQVVTFTPTKPGKYEMICDKKLLFFKSHKERGMHGIIEVVP